MKKLTKAILATMLALTPILAINNAEAKGSECPDKEPNSAQLFLTLPSEYNTPDGAALDPNGNIILSIPNFNNDHLIEAGKIKQAAPPVMAIIDKNNSIATWYQFKKEDMQPDTGKVGPMDAAFGPDGNLYIADMQIFWNPADNKIYIADFLGNGAHAVDMQGNVTTLHKNGDTTGADGLLDQPCEVIIRGNELIIVNMDMAWAVPAKLQVDRAVDQPYTLSVIKLKK